MIIFAACSGMMMETYSSYLQPRFCLPEPRFSELRSFHELRTFTGHTLPTYGRPFFFDSGAFSAYSVGAPITVEEYANFLEAHASRMTVYANLDSIPKSREPHDLEIAAEETLKNQKFLEERGFSPLPVFHMNEPWKYLEKYVAEYGYICLGGLVDAKALEKYFDKVWSEYLTDDQGIPKVKVHGFGMTSVSMMTKYPWYSVDSSTWLVHSKLGIISFPRRKATNEWDWNLRPTLLGISDNSGMRKDAGTHYDNMTDSEREAIHEYLNLRGVALEELRGHPAPRFAVNLEYWMDLEKHARFAKTFSSKQFSLL